jgi:hypothetical protein
VTLRKTPRRSAVKLNQVFKPSVYPNVNQLQQTIRLAKHKPRRLLASFLAIPFITCSVTQNQKNSFALSDLGVAHPIVFRAWHGG